MDEQKIENYFYQENQTVSQKLIILGALSAL